MNPDAGLSRQPVPAAASIRRRVLGWSIDYAVVMIPGLTLVTLALVGLVHALPGYVGAVGADVGWSQLMRLIIHHSGDTHVVRAAAADEWTAFARPLIGALLAVPLLQFAYHATLLSWPGRTIGKIVTDTRVDRTRTDGTPRRYPLALRRALTTTVVETGLVGVALAAITLGHFYIGGAIWGLAVVAFWINAFVLLGPRRRTLVDRLAGTVVVRTAIYKDVAERVRALEVSRRTTDAALAVRDQTSDLAVATGRMTFDAAAVAGQLVREGAGAIVGNTTLQQALNSRAGQQAQAITAAGAGKARELGGQAAGSAHLLGDRAQQAWKARRSQRQQQELRPLPEEPHGLPPSEPPAS